MSDISRAGGPLPARDTFAQAPQDQVATVQAGESKLSDVAKRLGLDHQELQKANPQISDADLKAGQEIRLPQNQAARGPEQAESDDDETVDHLAPPLGDPLAKSFIQARLEGPGSHPKTDLSGSDLAQLRGGVSAGNEIKRNYSHWKEEAFGKISPAQHGYQKDALVESVSKKVSPYDKDLPQFTKDNVYKKDDLAHVAGHDLTIMKVVDKSAPLLSDQPSENVSLNFGKIKMEYKPQDKIAPSGPEPPNPALLKPIKEETSVKGFDIQALKPW